MTADQTRAEFEAWLRNHVDFHPTRLNRYEADPQTGTPHGEYIKSTVQSMWEGWQAAMSARLAVSNEMVERAAFAIDPDLFSSDQLISNRAASPYEVDFARKKVRDLVQKALTAALGETIVRMATAPGA